jgi:hypothetical protein
MNHACRKGKGPLALKKKRKGKGSQSPVKLYGSTNLNNVRMVGF